MSATGGAAAAPIETRHHTTPDGADIGYRYRAGRDPWVLLHGLGCDASMWDEVVALLPPDRGLVVPDLRGHGRSTLGWRTPAIDLWAEDVAAILDCERFEAPAIAGLSMGGYTAMAFDAAHPGRARAIGLVSTQAQADDDAGRGRRADGLALLRREGWRAWADGMLPLLFAAGRPDLPRQRDRFLEMAARAGSVGIAAALFALANRPDRRAGLAAIRRPAIAVVGAEDRLTPPDRAREIASIVPGCRLVILTGVAHMSASEDPRGVAGALTSLV